MVRLNRIYTRTGDDGTTGLVDGSRTAKHAPRMAAIGAVDEANCAIGVALLQPLDEGQAAMLSRIQNELFDLGADLATPGTEFTPDEMTLRVVPAQVARLEAEIDAMNAGLAPLKSFILPGGTPAAAHTHVARAAVRRAERAATEAAAAETLNPAALAYLNRLSDHLFVLARVVAGDHEVLWRPGATRAPCDSPGGT
ncbi:cob(I)yrinic acid a,c-diamide adenosyltransferase [Sphingomonas quercus]|uniref:Corrinoid adenosyltransferase n=1 Tax=Sphingomonas quercus TaxID=2842451 RepID=A0ABS6BIR1_9SPHN|nr:cob(I)yrinic acid a,c-diamide adenosyltransferase [Sphingomonas quercus]